MTDNKKKTHLVITGRGGGGSGEQVQADWNQTDDTQVDYIKNKPSLATVATSGDYDDLTNKPTIPAAQVNADWNAVSGVAQILNKPTIPPQQWFGTQAEYDLIDPKDPNVIYNIEGSDNVQADWNQSDSSADDYIKNKPTIPAAQVQTDWNQSDTTAVDYIKNKPTIPTVPAMATETLTFTLQGGTTKTIDFYTVPNYFYVEDISGSDNTLSITGSNSNPIEIFKSTDRSNWTSMGTTSSTAITATIPANSKLYIKSTATKYDGTHFNATGNHNVGGNSMSLLYGDNFDGKTALPNSNYVLKGIFNSDTHLVNTNKLELPATTLANYCYSNMFNGCTSLVTAPVLPATTLTKQCYGGMFRGCTALTTAPVLPATNTANSCYSNMFNGCTSLNRMVVYANGSGFTTYCISNWLDGVAAQGDFYNLGGITYPSGDSGIPSGWTEHTSL